MHTQTPDLNPGFTGALRTGAQHPIPYRKSAPRRFSPSRIAIVLRSAAARGVAALHHIGKGTLSGAAACIENIRASRFRSAVLCFSFFLILPVSALARPATRVTLDGNTIAFAADAGTVQSAVQKLNADLSDLTAQENLIAGLHFEPGFATVNQIADVQKTMQAVVSRSPALDMLAVLRVDGEVVGACADPSEVQQALDQIMYRFAGNGGEARFTEDVSVSMSAAPSGIRLSPDALFDQIRRERLLNVQVTKTLQYTEEIPYQTITLENAQLDQNTQQTLRPGINGAAKVTAEVTVVNGVEQERTIVSRAVLKNSVNQVLEVGTRNVGIGMGALASPLTSYRYTSGFKFRGDHWHKGVDLCTPEGSPVYASDNGKVVVSEWSDSYGYYVVIDHQNGIRTLYAHNSQLVANVGDTVALGDQIAFSGNTGNSSGPHVHFEVHVDGEAVDPALYLALSPLTN